MLFSTPALAITFPLIDPVIVEVGSVAIRWYALSYIIGILLGWWCIGKFDNKTTKVFSKRAYDDFIVWAVIGIMIGGRAGYVLFYNLDYYLEYPAEILAIWKGGMSFHGGLVGSALSMLIMCKLYKIKFLPAVDLVAAIAPIGLFFGRIANFINAELYGRITNQPWGVLFPEEVYARHPSQIYEAILEGVVLFLIMLFFIYKKDMRKRAGFLSGVFLVGYSTFRGFVEIFREPDTQLGFIFFEVTMGQILSIPMFLLGIYLISRGKKSASA